MLINVVVILRVFFGLSFLLGVRRDSSLVAHTYVRVVPALMIKFKKKVTPFASISFTQSKGTPNACSR